MKILTKIKKLGLVAAMLLSASQGWATLHLNSEGTAYVINTKEDLIELMNTPSYWKSDFVQNADIDLEGVDWQPIGNGATPFGGGYDGKGFTIKNLTVRWDSASGNYLGKGFFGFVHSTTKRVYLRNIHFDNAHITRTTAGTTINDDLRIGILAGHIGQYVKISGISITNSRIDDGGDSHYTGVPDSRALTMFVGSVVGDVASSYGGTNDMTSYNENQRQHINNIVSQVDIDLSNTTHQTTTQEIKKTQFHVGGIVGRYRKPNSQSIPYMTVFTGRINAPLHSVGPVYGSIRHNTDNNAGQITLCVQQYAGEISDTKVIPRDTVNNNRYFYNFDIVNYALDLPTSKRITSTYPESVHETFGIRTFVPNAYTVYPYQNPKGMAGLQGVNAGTWLPALDSSATPDDLDGVTFAQQRDEILQRLNSVILGDDADCFGWVWENGTFVLKRKTIPVRFYTLDILLNHDNSYQARVTHTATSTQCQDEGYWRWYRRPDMSSGDWELIEGANTSLIYGDNQYYMVEWSTDPEFSESLTRIRAPYARIYIYDRAQTQRYQAQYGERYPEIMGFDVADFPVDGDDDNDGYTPQTPVKTFKAAYERLHSDGDIDRNMIVVMGYRYDPVYMYSSADYNKPVTITGTDYTTVFGGTLGIHYTEKNGPDNIGKKMGIYAPTRWEYVNVMDIYDQLATLLKNYEWPNPEGVIHADTQIYCNYNDFFIGEQVYFYNFHALSANGLPGNMNRVISITIVGGVEDDNTTDPISIPSMNRDPRVSTIEVLSGVFGRIISGSRNTNSSHPNRTTGTHDGPARVRLTVNIQGANTLGGRQGTAETQRSPYGYFWGYSITSDGTAIKSMSRYYFSHDVGIITGGQTDGSIFGDMEINILDGLIARVASGNITYGRPIAASPDDSFFGRTIINMYGGMVHELFGGSLGRSTGRSQASSSDYVDAYFYGQSIINIYGGAVKKYDGVVALNQLNDVEPNVYGCGAGGISGVGYPSIPGYDNPTAEDLAASQYTRPLFTTYTPDKMIPYIDENGKLAYGPFDVAYGRVPTILALDGSEIDLNLAKSVVNIYGGVVEGNVYGAGYGYANHIDAEYLHPMAGTMFGDVEINIAESPTGTSPHILGDVYGAGAGSSNYDIDNQYLGMLFGRTNVNISGGRIEGHVFGGSQGIHKQNYHFHGAIFGSTHLNISGNASINGSVYGGCSFGSIYKSIDDESGSTFVTIDGNPTLGNSIFGGSRGDFEDIGRDNTPIIRRDTHITINGGSFTPESTLDDGSLRLFNIYGGGNQSCIIDGNTYLDITRSLLTSRLSAVNDENDFAAYYEDHNNRRFCVYGGGFGESASVAGSTNVNINIDSYDILIDPNDGVDFYPGKVFFDIAGGGYAGHVGSTNLTIDGNTKVRKVVGGGFFGSVFETTNTRFKSGIAEEVIGGCLMGYVFKSAHLDIGTHTPDGSTAETNKTLWITGNVYGGNDVQGIIGAEVANGTEAIAAEDHFDPRVLYRANVDDPTLGAFTNIYGGQIIGSVYGAGNGHYRGYYVPGWGSYQDGPERFYRLVPARLPRFEENPERYPYRNRVYKTRPTIGRISLNIQGNNEDDRVMIGESVFGGGRDCTVGQWNSSLQVGDPRRLTVEKGGVVKINYGSHVTVANHAHMGARGRYLGDQPLFDDYSNVEAAMNYDGDVVPEALLDRVGTGAYYHWYYNSNEQKYRPGFAAPGEFHPNPFDQEYTGQNPGDPDNPYFLCGEHQFFGYMKFIEMASKVYLSFYDDPWEGGQLRLPPAKPEDVFLHSTVSDIQFASFFLGGERGFMTYDPPSGSEEYAYDLAIPSGVTITDKAVAGGEDTWIRFYPYNADYSGLADSENPMYELPGGLTMQSTFDDENGNFRMKNVPGVGWVPDIIRNQRERKYAIRLSINAHFAPQLADNAYDSEGNIVDDTKRFGGLIYGGCFTSGVVNGDVVLNVNSDLLNNMPEDQLLSPQTFGERSSLHYNVGRVYGGGFGEKTIIQGNTYVHLLRRFKGMNVFGGANQGTVEGNTNVLYFGDENSFIYGAIYGGGMIGNVGRHDSDMNPLERYATNIDLISGNVAKVYGGGCLGDVYGGTYIHATDRVVGDIPYLDLSTVDTSDWSEARLVAGSIFGGNDIAGNVITDENISPYSSYILVDETQMTDPGTAGKDSPGSHNGYNGFPLIGNVYGGSNGNYGIHDDNGYYAPGSTMVFTSGNQADNITIDLSTLVFQGRNFRVPHIERSHLDIRGGTIINAYGGGNKSTITDLAQIDVNYTDTVARAGFETRAEALRLWKLLELTEEEEFDETLRPMDDNTYVVHRQILRLFGGNDDAAMDIQPRWNLRRGHIGSVYSGGNMGAMTYYNPSPDPTAPEPWLRNRGLSIWVESPEIHLEAIFGGSRCGTIEATDENGVAPTFPIDEYGANVLISDGLIEAVYGGNDVTGKVVNGTHVMIRGAISGDVYGAGNGNYLYQYDTTGNFTRPVTEVYDASKGGRYFILKALDEYGGTSASDAQRLMAINDYRPHVDRSRLDIGGSESSPVYVKGNVYCGGNSSTVTSQSGYQDIVFHIGSYVTLNGVFLGSNGESLTDFDNIKALLDLNDNLDIEQTNKLTAADIRPEDASAVDYDLYPTLLSLYMRAVEVTAKPREFAFDDNLTEAFIGTFCVGGNHGSMMTSEPIHLQFPEALTIYERIIGGCANANVKYLDTEHIGGLTKPLDAAYAGQPKVELDIASTFMPLVLYYPSGPGPMDIKRYGYMIGEEGQDLYFLKNGDSFQYYSRDENGALTPISYTDALHYANGQCNIYGGCYTSGKTVGDIVLNIYSDMMDYGRSTFNPTTGVATDGRINKQAIINGMTSHQWRAFDIIGGGYGRNTEVIGNTFINMMPGVLSPFYTAGTSPEHPSTGAIFGGSQMGRMVGNTHVFVRDGNVLTNIYGASEAAKMFGSSHVVVGYPNYYVANTSGDYSLDCADDMEPLHSQYNHDGTEVVRTHAAYLAGEIVPVNVYEMMSEEDKAGKFDLVTLRPEDLVRTSDNSRPVSWNNIEINIGDQMSQFHPDAPFYGQGNIYGGGFVGNNNDQTMAGSLTVCRYNAVNNLGAETIGYGGNSSVMIWDNPRNADYSIDESAYRYTDDNGVTVDLRDHISVSTGRYQPIKVGAERNVMGLFLRDSEGLFHHQPSLIADPAQLDNYYEFVADGGIYGGGRKVYVEGFRGIDLGYYGYADHTPQSPKLLNTLQRADLVTVRDCAIMLHGASDFTPNHLDTELYSINRVGSLKMVSSLPPTATLDPGEQMSGSMNYNIDHNKRRSRNYIAMFQHVNYLAAFSSSVSFGEDLHGADGTLDNSESYLDYKHRIIRDYDNALGSTVPSITSPATANFNKRNVGTAANMIGISNGYPLRIQGYWTVGEGVNYDEYFYYGPVYGVTELKLLTLSVGEGGGYILARNHHYDENYDTETPQSSHGPQDFLHTTANFVFPGAAYLTGGDEYNYVLDDCYPLLYGYYQYKEDWEHGNISAIPGMQMSPGDDFDVNKVQEVHYWYVNGQKFFFNLTLTGYTGNSAENPMSFWLENTDGFAALSGTTPGSTIKVKSVTWDSNNSDDSDIMNLERPYSLRLTVDNNTRLGNAEGDVFDDAYIVNIPRADYNIESGTSPDFDPNADNTTVFRDHADSKNTPTIGLRLLDAVNNGSQNDEGLTAIEYYRKHFGTPDHVTIVLTSKDENDVEFEYTINLTINYIVGPEINGNIEIENCALPGEYIYVNANNVSMTMDSSSEDLLSVTERAWYIFPVDSEGNVSLTGFNIDAFKYDGSDLQIRIPAYWYQNGWQVRYREKINGRYFDAYTSSTSDHPALEIHNYHRMRPSDGTRVLDLRLVAGARVYIEDDRDLEYFFTYLANNQNETVHGDEFTYNLDYYGINIDPQYARGINFFVQQDVNVPNTPYMGSEPITFGGALHVNGHILHIGNLTQLPIRNIGKVYNGGFVSDRNDPSTKVCRDNTDGTFVNCYYYNRYGQGSLATEGTLVNCYQNTPLPSGISLNYNQLLSISDYAFKYGQVAYNLNGFYLDKRDLLLTVGGAENRHESLNAVDAATRGNAALAVPYMESMFNNGDYRYALWKGYDQFIEALRTREMPNYFDMRERHAVGQSPTHHDITHPRDLLRWDDTAEVYRPNFSEDDYLFFGEMISADAPADELPHLFSPSTRVYRSSGFYGDHIDRGSFFNRDAYVGTARITAIDVTGYRDLDPVIIAERDRLHADRENWDGWIIHPLQEVYYPPTLDMPYTADNRFDVPTLTVSDDITQNLLFYSTASDPLLEQFHYQDGFMSVNNGHDEAMHDESRSTIRVHHIVSNGADDFADIRFAVYGGEFHLVDMQDFNAPIAFDVEQAWYNRAPKGFADAVYDKTAWEGICLPFTIGKVYAASVSGNMVADHGEVSHFYSDEETLHEYWLRRFVDTNNDALVFERPTVANDQPAVDFTADYSYFNNFFYNTYRYMQYDEDGIPENNGDTSDNHNEYDTRHEFSNYRYLTASVPYIVTYPGRRFLEFDMSGLFYADKINAEISFPQTICYMSFPNSIVEVTDYLPAPAYSHDGVTVEGTFRHVTATSDDPLAAIAEYDPDDPTTADGSKFEPLHAGDIVEPFRVYAHIPTSGTGPMPIVARRSDGPDLPVVPVDPEEEDYEQSDDNGLRIRVEGRVLIVESPYETVLTLYDTLGRGLRFINVDPGVNRYYDIPSGFYLLDHTKFRMP